MADNYGSPDSSPRSDNESGGHVGGHNDYSIKEQDRFLPIANVGRIMKKALPANGKVSKDAKETVQECVSEFISFITGEASDKCQREKRKTINGDDLLWAMSTLGFEEYVEPLKIYLHKYREMEGEKVSMAKQGDHQSRMPMALKTLILTLTLMLIFSPNYNRSYSSASPKVQAVPQFMQQQAVAYGQPPGGVMYAHMMPYNMAAPNSSGGTSSSNTPGGTQQQPHQHQPHRGQW